MTYLEKTYNLEDPNLVSIFDELSLWSSYFVRLLLDNVELRPNLNVLDVGFGTGVPIFELAQRLGATCHITGIDPWAAAVERAKWKQETLNIQNVTLVTGDAKEMPFDDDHFDMIVSNLSLNNLSDSEKLLQECHRVLKKGGKLYLTTNTVGHYREFYDVYETVLKELKKKHLLPILKQQENHRGNLESIRENLENANFSITKIIKDRFQWRYLDGSALLNHSLTVFGFLDGWRHILEGENEQEIFEKIEGKLNEIAEEDGELKMSVPMLYLEAVK